MHVGAGVGVGRGVVTVLDSLHPRFSFASRDLGFVRRNVLSSFSIIYLISTLSARFGVIVSNVSVLPRGFDAVRDVRTLLGGGNIARWWFEMKGDRFA